MKKILILNGPNLNMLGKREPEIYGFQTLNDINKKISSACKDVSLEFFQSNHEGALIDKIHETDADGVVINAGGLTHTSVALRDAVSSRKPLPFVEVHLSDIKKREEFRRFSHIEAVARASFSGEGVESYIKAVKFLERL